MNKKFVKIPQNLLIMFFVILFAGTISYVFAWAGPDSYGWSSPSDGNVDAPINVGSFAQDKNGWFTVANFGASGQSFFTTDPDYIPPSNAVLGVSGGLSVDKVYAGKYCNLEGDVCSDAGGGSVATTTTGSGSSRIYLGPKGCNSALTIDTTCKTLGWEGCTGSGCESRYYTCEGGPGGHSQYTCKTAPTNLYVSYDALGNDLIATTETLQSTGVPYDPSSTTVEADGVSKIRTSWTSAETPGTTALSFFLMKNYSDGSYQYSTAGNNAAFSLGHSDYLIKSGVPPGDYFIKITGIVGGRSIESDSNVFNVVTAYTGTGTLNVSTQALQKTGTTYAPYSPTVTTAKAGTTKMRISWTGTNIISTASITFTYVNTLNEATLTAAGNHTFNSVPAGHPVQYLDTAVVPAALPTGDYYVRASVPTGTGTANLLIVKSNVFHIDH